jgi:hypothetical protein
MSEIENKPVEIFEHNYTIDSIDSLLIPQPEIKKYYAYLFTVEGFSFLNRGNISFLLD